MNRLSLALLLLHFLLLITPKAYSQDPDSVSAGTDTARIERRETAVSDSLATGYSVPADSLASGRNIQPDSLAFREPDFTHSPYKAIMFALVLPGLGQAYNGKYYKIPIVWAAFGGAIYAISFNTGNYRTSSMEYALTPDDTHERYLRYWRRNLEISYISLLAVFALQVIDAYVDAQLYSWDVNENLSLGVVPSVEPVLYPGNLRTPSYGLTCRLNLKGRF